MIQGDIARGRIPVISLHCGDDITTNGGPYDIVQIAKGSADKDIQTLKTDLQGLTKDGQPYPVMLRWFWEMNVNAHWPMPTGPNDPDGPNGNNCYEEPNNAQFLTFRRNSSTPGIISKASSHPTAPAAIRM